MIPAKQSVRRLLVIKLRAVGDVVLSTIVLKNLRERFPGTTITFLTEPAGASILQGNPFIDKVLVHDRASMTGWRLIREVRRQRFDLVIDLFGNPRTALVTRLSGARVRVGFDFRGRAYAYNVLVAPRGHTVHNTQFNLDALTALGIPTEDRDLHIVPSEQDRRSAEKYWEKENLSGKKVIALNGGGGWSSKRWPLGSFAELAERVRTSLDAVPLLIWGPGEEIIVEEILRKMRVKPLVAPSTTLLELASFLVRCALLVSNDSGPMHIGAAMGIPVLGIFGPTLPQLQGPYGKNTATVRQESLECLGCNLTRCPIGNPCMNTLTVDSVYAAAEQLLSVPRFSST